MSDPKDRKQFNYVFPLSGQPGLDPSLFSIFGQRPTVPKYITLFDTFAKPKQYAQYFPPATPTQPPTVTQERVLPTTSIPAPEQEHPRTIRPSLSREQPRSEPDNVVAFSGIRRARATHAAPEPTAENGRLSEDVVELREQVKNLTQLVTALLPAINYPYPSPNPVPVTEPSRLLPPSIGPTPILPEFLPAVARQSQDVFPPGMLLPPNDQGLIPRPNMLPPDVLPPAPALAPVVNRDVRRTVIHCPDDTERTVATIEEHSVFDQLTGGTTLETTSHRYMGDDGNMLPDNGAGVYACTSCKRTGFAHVLHCTICECNLCSQCVNTVTSADEETVTIYCDHHFRGWQRSHGVKGFWESLFKLEF
jgi:hypothetical protein